MDKRGEYLNIYRWLEDTLRDVSSALVQLRNELYQPLEDEKNEKVAQSTDAEVLREYVKISRDISTLLFDKIHTHSLTIERLSDHILCRRQYKAVKPTRTINKETPLELESAAIADQLAVAMKGMTLEQQEEYLKKLMGG